MYNTLLRKLSRVSENRDIKPCKRPSLYYYFVQMCHNTRVRQLSLIFKIYLSRFYDIFHVQLCVLPLVQLIVNYNRKVYLKRLLSI